MSSKNLIREGKDRRAFGHMSGNALYDPWKAIGRASHLLISLFVRTTLNYFEKYVPGKDSGISAMKVEGTCLEAEEKLLEFLDICHEFATVIPGLNTRLMR